MRLISLTLLAAAALSAQPSNPFAYLPAEGRLLSMQWRRVLDSPLRDAVRKEIPADLLPLVSSVNFIEGIQRVAVARDNGRDVVVLSGRFDLDRITAQASEDDGVSTYWRGARFLAPAGARETDSQIALVNPGIVIIGPGDLLKAAIGRSLSKRVPMQPPAYDLWLRAPDSTFGLLVGDPVRVEAVVTAESSGKAKVIVENAMLQNMTAVQNDREVVLTTNIPRARFVERAGNWRASLESLHTAQTPPAPVVPHGPQKIRIYGLEGGPREIDLPAPKP